MAYRILKKLIADGSRPKEKLMEMADVYYAAGRITGDQYADIIDMIRKNGTNSTIM